MIFCAILVLGMMSAVAYGANKPPLTEKFFKEVEKLMEKSVGYGLTEDTPGSAAMFTFLVLGQAWLDGNDFFGTVDNLKEYVQKKLLCNGKINVCQEIDKAVAQHKAVQKH